MELRTNTRAFHLSVSLSEKGEEPNHVIENKLPLRKGREGIWVLLFGM